MANLQSSKPSPLTGPSLNSIPPPSTTTPSTQPLCSREKNETGYQTISPHKPPENNQLSSKSSPWGNIFRKYKYILYGLSAILTFILIYLHFHSATVSLQIESKHHTKVPDLVRVKALKPLHFPNHKKGKRLIVVGDIHGMLDEFQELIEKVVKFNHKKDHLVLLGDMISKGPDSVGVLEFAMALNASCVRGNHEDTVLHAYASIHDLPAPKINPPQGFHKHHPSLLDRQGNGGLQKKSHRTSDLDVAKQLQPSHVAYLGTCPAIISLGKVGFHNSHAVAVHAGLQWNIDTLDAQDPETVFTMRSLVPPDFTVAHEEPDGKPWSTVWNQKQSEKARHSERTTVFYGHDARKGLSIKKYTAGLDSACFNGGKLTAMVISLDADGKPSHKIKHVSCPG